MYLSEQDKCIYNPFYMISEIFTATFKLEYLILVLYFAKLLQKHQAYLALQILQSKLVLILNNYHKVKYLFNTDKNFSWAFIKGNYRLS